MAREMKESGIRRIGTIPANWDICRFKFVSQLYTGNSIKDEEKAFYEDPADAVPYLASKDLDVMLQTANYENGMYVKKADTSFRFASPGSTLMCIEGGSAGRKKTLLKQQVAFVNKLCCFKPISINGNFLFYWLCSPNYEDEFRQNITGLIGGVSVSALQNFTIAIPPRAEQECIAAFLDAKCALIDTVVEQTRASIEEYKKLKQSMITEAVTKGIRPGRKMKDCGIQWIGEIPEDWAVLRIANLYEERNERGTEELPILSVSINTGISDHEIPDDEMSRIFLRSADRTLYKRVYPGDLAYNMMRAWQGAFGAVRVEGMVSPAYVVANPKNVEKMDSRYVEALLRTPSAVEEMHRYSRGITDFRLRLYWPEFKNIRICVPPIQEQKEIADYLDEKSAVINALIEQKTRLITELESYKKSLIYEYVTGKKEVPAAG